MVLIKRLALLLFLVPVYAFGQDTTEVYNETYSKKEIKASGDSLMHYYLGDMYKYCHYKKKGYYTYIDTNNGKLHYSMLGKHKRVPGRLKYVVMSYKLDYPYPFCEAYSKITGTIFLKMDSTLDATDRPDMRFIPDFVWANENCKLITKEEAIALAINFGFKESAKPPKARIEYDQKIKQFYWFVSNRIPKDSTIQKRFVTQTMQINAVTRKKVTYTKSPTQPGPQH